MRRATNGGRTFESQTRVVIAHETKPAPTFEDKSYVVVDNGRNSPFRGTVYM